MGADALERVLEALRGQQGSEDPVDLLITDYVYDKVGKRHKHVVRFDNVMQPNARLTWDDLGRFWASRNT